MKKLGVALILIGVGLLVYGILDFGGGGQDRYGGFRRWGWSAEARLTTAVGAVLAIGGSLLYRARN